MEPQTIFRTRPFLSRWLDLSTFGPTKGQVEELSNTSINTWFRSQVETPFYSHKSRTIIQHKDQFGSLNTSKPGQTHRIRAWIDIALFGEDQLRQRIAYALSQIFVVSDNDFELRLRSKETANYYDILCGNAFDSFSDLLKKVTLSPVMGHYLTMVDNKGPNPDENYAREILQLFSMGLYERNNDGTYKLDAKKERIPCYTEHDIRELARVFTGWTRSADSWENEMIEKDDNHDKGEKTLFNGNLIIPANGSAESELDSVLNYLESHPSTAPNICFKLIQLLTTSNPRRQYVQRVVDVFLDGTSALNEIYENNIPESEYKEGNLKKVGNLKAVIWTILTDKEVYYAPPKTMSKVREPWLSIIRIYRALNVDVIKDKNTPIGDPALKAVKTDLLYKKAYNQYPLGAPSVFNFYLPEHKIRQTPIGKKEAIEFLSPELQIIDWSHIISTHNLIYLSLIKNNQYQSNLDYEKENIDDYYNLKDGDDNYNNYKKRLFVDIANFHEALINRITTSDSDGRDQKLKLFINQLSSLFFNYLMPDSLQETLYTALPDTYSFDDSIDNQLDHKIWIHRLLALALSSPHFHIQQNNNYLAHTVTPANR